MCLLHSWLSFFGYIFTFQLQVYSSAYYMTRYLAIGVGGLVVIFLGYLLIEAMSLIAAKTLYKSLLMSIIHAPLR